MPIVTFDFMDVGQGDCTFIQVCDNNKIDDDDITPSHALLVDFGSVKNGFIAGPDTVKYIQNQLQKIKPSPTLDLLLFTHSDQDHHNQTSQLWEIPGLQISECVFGGQKELYSYYTGFGHKRRKINTIGSLELKGVTCSQIASNCTSIFNTASPAWKRFGGANKLDLWVIVGNFPARDRGDTNDRSIVLLCQYGGKKVILPGDATVVTLREINRWINKKHTESMVKDTSTLKLPHHGAERTTLDGSGVDKWKVTEDFINLIRAKTITVSADTRLDYRHPRETVIEKYRHGYVESGLYKKHRYISWGINTDDEEAWVHEDTTDNIFTSLIATDQGIQWQFRIDEKGKVDMFSTNY